MKKIALSLGLLISAATMSAVQIAMTGSCGGHTFNKVVTITDDQKHFECNHGHGITIKTDLVMDDETITYCMNIIQKQEDGTEQVIAKPVVVGEWGKEAILTIGELSPSVDREVTLTLVATK